MWNLLFGVSKANIRSLVIIATTNSLSKSCRIFYGFLSNKMLITRLQLYISLHTFLLGFDIIQQRLTSRLYKMQVVKSNETMKQSCNIKPNVRQAFRNRCTCSFASSKNPSHWIVYLRFPSVVKQNQEGMILTGPLGRTV